MATVDPLSNFTVCNLTNTEPTTSLDLSPVRLAGIPALFAAIRDTGDILAAGDSGVFTKEWSNCYTGANVEGVDAAVNHLQGLHRREYDGKSYLLASAADFTQHVSHLMVIQMASRPERGPWGSNLITSSRPPEVDGIVRIIALDPNRCHAGGIGWLGDVIAVPLEGDEKSSEVRLLHVGNPQHPTQLPVGIMRATIPKAGGVALGALADGRIACVVWREEGKSSPVGRLDCYLSRSSNLFDGFGDAVTVPFSGLGRNSKRDPQYQTLTFLHPADDPDTLFYVIGMENEAADAPFGCGDNVADLLRIPMGNVQTAKDLADRIRAMTLVDTRRFQAPRDYCNFDAATGVYIDQRRDGARLNLYGAFHWRAQHCWRFAEFAGTPVAGTPVTDASEGWIELYEHARFRGRRLLLHGSTDTTIADYRRIWVQDGRFDDTVSSVRWQLPRGVTYRLYDAADFRGRTHDLIGGGSVDSIPDLGALKFGDSVSSSRFVQT